ncbi:13587_t:CDS:1 [Dentiscutata erythropus]|uniref:13587_t:CDS:1 n=1 Tax=Dentiscutata erythropus TaxID=1348616 RepID=A0A9N8V7L7_9GLOM|nr:13587_t:CDS:1 [Dentiscutata erythropus]
MTQVKKLTSKRAEAQKKIKVFQRGEQKIKLDIHRERPILPPLPLPYPPATRVEKIVEKLISKPKLARFPNAFIMYRNEYVQFLKASGLSFPMTELSPMISYSWKHEPPCVKDAYTQISSEAERLYVQTIATPKDSNNQNQGCDLLSLPENDQDNDNPPSDIDPTFQNENESQYHDNYLHDYNTFLGMPSYFLEQCENSTTVQTNSSSSESSWLTESYELSTNDTQNSVEQGNNDDTLTNQGQHAIFDGQLIDWTNLNESCLPVSPSRRCSESSINSDLSSCDMIHLMNETNMLTINETSPAPYINQIFPENLPLPIFDNLHGQFDDQSFFTPSLDTDSLSSQYDSNPQTPASPQFSASSINDKNKHELSEITIDIYSAIDCALSSFKLNANNDY